MLARPFKFDPVISDTLSAIRQGNFKKARTYLDALIKLGKLHLEADAVLNDCDALTALSLAAEIYAHYEELKEQVKMFRHVERVIVSIRDEHADSGQTLPSYPRILRARCWYVLQYAVYRYRTNDYNGARAYLELAAKPLVGKDDESTTFDGALSHNYYWQGNVYRHLQQYPTAIGFYQKAMESIQKNLKAHSDSNEHKTFCLFRLANVQAMGLGWSHLRSGDLASAKSCLLAAQTLMDLASGGNRLRRGYAKMLLGVVYRAEVGPLQGKEKEKIRDSAVRLLREAKEDFEAFVDDSEGKKKGHSLYLARVHSELAVAALNYGEAHSSEAHTEAREAIKYADLSNDAESWCLAHIVLSRIARRRVGRDPDKSIAVQLQESMVYAKMAANKARETGQDMPEFEALIEQGETYFDMASSQDPARNLEQAISCFTDANERSVHPRHKAICSLHLARTYNRQGQRTLAAQSFKKYEESKTRVQNGFIQNFASIVEGELNQSFLVLEPPSDLEGRSLYSWLEEKVRQFVVDYVGASPDNKGEMIKGIGVSRPKFYKWQKEVEAKRAKKASPQDRQPK